MSLPAVHALREELHDEVYARPLLPLQSPCRVSCIALPSGNEVRHEEWRLLRDLGVRFGVVVDEAPAANPATDFGTSRLRWERPTEFSRYIFVVDGAAGPPFSHPAIGEVPKEWVERLPGRAIYAGHFEVVAARACVEPDLARLSKESFGDRPLVGSEIADDAATILTVFRIDAQGYSRALVVDRALKSAQAGRLVQALLEVDMYRMPAPLAFPVARELSPVLSRNEQELAEIANQLVKADSTIEPELLDRLTSLPAQIERLEADHRYRFSAASAYFDIVTSRLSQLRERPCDSLQTWQEFMERRLAPAMNTCKAAMTRLGSLSQHGTRVTQLFSTRIGITRESQNQQLLESMNQCTAAQLRLQATVEGLAVAAITYCIVALIKILANGLGEPGWPIDAGFVTAISISVVGGLVITAVRKVRRSVVRHTGDMS